LLAAWLPLASAAVYFGWLARDSVGFDPCAARSLNYGLLPFLALPVMIVAIRARIVNRPWLTVIGLAAAAAMASVLALAFVWF
jgi:hypothetical protein